MSARAELRRLVANCDGTGCTVTQLVECRDISAVLTELDAAKAERDALRKDRARLVRWMKDIRRGTTDSAARGYIEQRLSALAPKRTGRAAMAMNPKLRKTR